MPGSLGLLTLTAASLGALHTLLGPDHYLPFVMMARAGRWSRGKTIAVTVVCGVGHILSSVALGLAGIALGAGLGQLMAIETFRGRLAAWAFIACGLVYFIWGLRRAVRYQPHSHWHAHGDGTLHRHVHIHAEEHLHVHPASESAPRLARLTPWVLFIIFVFGPCEPLIPLLLYPAAMGNVAGIVLVTAAFGGATLLTMVLAVLVGQAGLDRLFHARLERYAHALAGAALLLCGVAIEFLGL